MTAISVYSTQEKTTANGSCGQAQLPWHLITCTTVSILPVSLQQICHLFPLTITRIKLCIYFHTFTSTADQFSHTNALLSSDLASSCSLRTEPKSCLCKNNRAWCIQTNLLDRVINNFFKAAVPQFKWYITNCITRTACQHPKAFTSKTQLIRGYVTSYSSLLHSIRFCSRSRGSSSDGTYFPAHSGKPGEVSPLSGSSSAIT